MIYYWLNYVLSASNFFNVENMEIVWISTSAISYRNLQPTLDTVINYFPQVEGVVNGTAPEVVTNAEFVKAFGSALGRPTFIPVPEFFFNLVFGEERAAIVLRYGH